MTKTFRIFLGVLSGGSMSALCVASFSWIVIYNSDPGFGVKGPHLFWIHDPSPKHRRTYRLINNTVELLDRLIHLASNPFMRPLRKQALRLVAELRDAAESLDDESEAL